MFSREELNDFWHACVERVQSTRDTLVETALAMGEATVDELKKQFCSASTLTTVAVNATSVFISGYSKFDQNKSPNIIDLVPALISCLYSFCSIKDACDKVRRQIPANYRGQGISIAQNQQTPHREFMAEHIHDNLRSTEINIKTVQCIIAILTAALYVSAFLKPSLPLRIAAFLLDTSVALIQTIIGNSTIATLIYFMLIKQLT